MTGTGGPGSGYAVGGRLVLTSAHVTGPAGTRVQAFHPGGTGTADGTVMWAGTPGQRDDAALVLVDDSPHWQPPAMPVRWGRLVTTRPGTKCEASGVPDEAQRPRLAVETEQLAGRINPGTGFVNNQYVMDLDQHPPHRSPDGSSPWGGMSGAAVLTDRLLIGVVASDRARSGHARLNVVPAYVLHHDPAFRMALAAYGGGPGVGLEAAEFQDLADRTNNSAGRPAPATPAALLEAGRQIVPFHGRRDLLAELRAWCGVDGFGAWLLHGPGGQGKTRLAHHLGRELAGEGWAVLWPRLGARPDQLLEVRRTAKPLLVVLDYAETRPEQLTALVEAAADHHGTSPFKLILLARTDGDWWHEVATATRQAEDHLITARTHRLAPLEDDPDRRDAHYREAAQALAATLPLIDGLAGHDWTTASASLSPPRHLGQDAYGNALTLHMTALADLLDTTQPRSGTSAPASGTASGGEAQNVEDRLLGHERRYWRDSAAALDLTPGLRKKTLESALAAAHLVGAVDRERADQIWQRLPALADQMRNRRDQVTDWLAALYPTDTALGGQPWGALQPDRLAERHIGRVLETDPSLADHLLDGADETQTAQLLTVYSRAASHPVFQERLDARLTDLCVRHHRQLVPHTIATATRTDHPGPLVDALDTITTDPTSPLDSLIEVHSQLPRTSRRLAPTGLRLAHTITDRYRALAKANPDAHLPNLARALNNLSNCLGEVSRHEEGLTAVQEAVAIRRDLAEADRDAHLADLAMTLNNLAIRLGEMGRHEESLAPIQEAVGYYRDLAEVSRDAHLPDLAGALNNSSNRLSSVGRHQEGLAASREAVGYYRDLAEVSRDAHLPGLAGALNNLSVRLGEVGRHEEGLTAVQEAVAIRRDLAEANPDAHLFALASALNNLSVRLGAVDRHQESLAAVQEAVAIRRDLAEANRDAHLPDLAMTLNNFSFCLGEVGQREEGLAASREAVGYYRALAQDHPSTYLSDLARGLTNLAIRLREVGQREEALITDQEAIAIHRALAQDHPSTYLSDLARGLTNLAIRLREVGQR
ncbi:tetratricopeptide repeat protein, partial [Streptomyces spororaveus]|uniref:tetratricopeptide repeat protein n=1 Tax=Streptomyces spororaveus TaxID=284039 RepID=UPI0037B26F05